MPYEFDATKVFAHRWPHDTPKWSGDFQEAVDAKINTSSALRKVELADRSVTINGCGFEALKNVGVSVPFFRKECRMMFEGVCMGNYAHVHVYAALGADRYLEAFAGIADWMRAHGY